MSDDETDDADAGHWSDEDEIDALRVQLAASEKRRCEVENSLRSFAVEVAEVLGCDGIVTGGQIIGRAKAVVTALHPFALCVGDDGVVRGVALHDDYLAARAALAQPVGGGS